MSNGDIWKGEYINNFMWNETTLVLPIKKTNIPSNFFNTGTTSVANKGDYYDIDTGAKLGSTKRSTNQSYLIEASDYNRITSNCQQCSDVELESKLSAVATNINASDIAEYQKIVTQYNDMIADARRRGKNVAADLLQHFLDGSGSTVNIDSDWLRQNKAVMRAELRNQERFNTTIRNKYETMIDGSTIPISDYWDAMETASVLTELYYASGTFTVSSDATITLQRNKKQINASGVATIRWHDDYDWHGGLSAYIPGHGTISDSDALFLQSFGKASPFLMESTWEKKISGSIQVKDYWFDSFGVQWNLVP